MFLLSVLVTLQQALSSGYLNSVITTIEKRYEIPSSISGIIASMYEIGNVITVIFVSYLGSRRHIPVWIGMGKKKRTELAIVKKHTNNKLQSIFINFTNLAHLLFHNFYTRGSIYIRLRSNPQCPEKVRIIIYGMLMIMADQNVLIHI